MILLGSSEGVAAWASFLPSVVDRVVLQQAKLRASGLGFGQGSGVGSQEGKGVSKELAGHNATLSCAIGDSMAGRLMR